MESSKSPLQRHDEQFETSLRPGILDDFIGQEQVRKRLSISIGAAKQRGEALGHCLFHGPPGLGKTTLAAIVAAEMGSPLVVASGPSLDKPGDLAGILTNLREGSVLFIDEIHRLSRTVEEYLYPAMEDFSLDVIIDAGPQARSVHVTLNRFTLIGATTRLGLLTAPLRSRFESIARLSYYDTSLLTAIVLRSSRLLGLSLSDEAADEIARRARGTPRIANNLLRWVRDYAQMHAITSVQTADVHAALAMLDIDHKGLDELDKKLLELIIDHHGGGPVGVGTLAAALSEDVATLEEVHEPFLLMQGLLKRTPRGREVTLSAYEHLGKEMPKGNV
jgi:Holliday junction DNA helicase RuvB